MDVLRQGSGEDRPVRQLVAAAAVARVVRLDQQVLDGEILVAEEFGAVGQAVEQERHVLMDLQLSCLGAFGGAGSFSVGRVRFLLLTGSRWRAAGVVQRAGARLAFRLIRQPLQPPDLFFELLDSQLLLLDRRPQLINHAQQRFNQRSPLLRQNLDAANRLRTGLPFHAQSKASCPVFVKTDFHRVIEN